MSKRKISKYQTLKARDFLSQHISFNITDTNNPGWVGNPRVQNISLIPHTSVPDGEGVHNKRSGRRIQIKGIELFGWASSYTPEYWGIPSVPVPNRPTRGTLWIVQDMAPKGNLGTNTTYSDIFQPYPGFLQRDNEYRFKILYKQNFNFSGNGIHDNGAVAPTDAAGVTEATIHGIDKYIDLSDQECYIHYNQATNGSYPNIISGALILVTAGSIDHSTTGYVSSRVHFWDKEQ